MPQPLHAGLLAAHGPGGWRGVLIQGVSGAGKSDVGLRLIAAGFRLVADDRVILWASGGALFGRAPEVLHGPIEARGLGVISLPALDFCRIHLCVRDGDVERAPAPAHVRHLGLRLPTMTIRLLEESAPAKLHHALWHLGDREEGAYLGDLVAGASPRPGGDSR